MLSQRQIQILRSALDRIIPADDYPGAWEAGVGEYILRQLRGDLEPLSAAYSEGLNALDDETSARYGFAFQEIGPDQQDNLLRQLEKGESETVWPIPPARFLSMLIHHAAEGYYADPANGGNKGARSWQMVGFTPADPHAPGARTDLSESEKALQ